MTVQRETVNRNPVPKENLGKGKAATAMIPHPSDFPLGSPESRAAARAMLQQRTMLTLYDKDCLLLYDSTCHYLHGGADPDYSWMQLTEAYKHGREVSDLINGPVIPVHLQPDYPRSTFASKLFNLIHQRSPWPGDVLKYEDLALLFCPEETKQEVEELTAAWARRLTDYPCPYRYEEARTLVLQKDGSWRGDDYLCVSWAMVEDDALGITGPFYPEEPAPTVRMSGVVFIESKDGKRRTNPLTMTPDR